MSSPDSHRVGFDRVEFDRRERREPAASAETASAEALSAEAGAGAGDPVEHLWNAAHEFLAAACVVIDAADAVVLEQQRRASAPRAPRLRRIDVQ